MSLIDKPECASGPGHRSERESLHSSVSHLPIVAGTGDDRTPEKTKKAPLYVDYKWFVENGIFNNRTTLDRARKYYGFPPPIELSPNRRAWELKRVLDWLASRPRKEPKTSDNNP